MNNLVLKPFIIKRPPPHEISATSDLIEKAGLFKGRYKRGYWLRLIKKSGISYGGMMCLIKEMYSMDEKYNRGGWLTNKLKT